MSGPRCHSQCGDCGKTNKLYDQHVHCLLIKIHSFNVFQGFGSTFSSTSPNPLPHPPPPSAGIVAGLGFCYAGWVLVKSLEKHQWLQRAAHRGKHCVQKIIFLKGLCWRMIIWRMVLSCQGSFKVHRVAVSRGQLPYAPSALTQIFRRRHILQASVENWNCSCFPQCLLLFQLVTEI